MESGACGSTSTVNASHGVAVSSVETAIDEGPRATCPPASTAITVAATAGAHAPVPPRRRSAAPSRRRRPRGRGRRRGSPPRSCRRRRHGRLSLHPRTADPGRNRRHVDRGNRPHRRRQSSCAAHDHVDAPERRGRAWSTLRSRASAAAAIRRSGTLRPRWCLAASSRCTCRALRMWSLVVSTSSNTCSASMTRSHSAALRAE
jgi:hypothetical protein